MNRLQLSKKNVFKTGILFLQGVFKRDCKTIEDQFTDALLTDVESDLNGNSYDKIPVRFTTIKNWPDSTNLLCWYCNQSFKGRPWFEPKSIEPVSNGQVGVLLSSDKVKKSKNTHGFSIITNGIFCSCNCVRSYINLHSADESQKNDRIAMLRGIVYEAFTESTISDIVPSPPYTEMVQYGGELSRCEYRKKVSNLNKKYLAELSDNKYANICNIYMEKLQF